MELQDGQPPVDWQGRPVDCAACAHRGRRAAGGCEPATACVNDRLAGRVDRFFTANPDLADAFLTRDRGFYSAYFPELSTGASPG